MIFIINKKINSHIKILIYSSICRCSIFLFGSNKTSISSISRNSAIDIYKNCLIGKITYELVLVFDLTFLAILHNQANITDTFYNTQEYQIYQYVLNPYQIFTNLYTLFILLDWNISSFSFNYHIQDQLFIIWKQQVLGTIIYNP